MLNSGPMLSTLGVALLLAAGAAPAAGKLLPTHAGVSIPSPAGFAPAPREQLLELGMSSELVNAIELFLTRKVKNATVGLYAYTIELEGQRATLALLPPGSGPTPPAFAENVAAALG